MQRQVVLFAISALWSLPVVSGALDCADESAVRAEKDNCLPKFGITTGTNVDQLQDDIKQNLNASCSQMDKYKSVLSCAITIEKDCRKETGGDLKAISDSQKLSEGLTYLCDNLEEVDGACYNQVNPALQQCVYVKLNAEFSSTSDANTTLYTCKAFEYGFECMDEHLSACGGKTKEVFVNYAKYVMPPACDGAPFLHAASLWVLSLAALVAALFGSSLDF